MKFLEACGHEPIILDFGPIGESSGAKLAAVAADKPKSNAKPKSKTQGASGKAGGGGVRQLPKRAAWNDKHTCDAHWSEVTVRASWHWPSSERMA